MSSEQAEYDLKNAEVLEQAQKELIKKGAKKYFSAPRATRYYVQPLNDDVTACIMFGSAGTVDHGDGPEPISDVVTVVATEISMLLSLADTINELFPRDKERADG